MDISVAGRCLWDQLLYSIHPKLKSDVDVNDCHATYYDPPLI